MVHLDFLARVSDWITSKHGSQMQIVVAVLVEIRDVAPGLRKKSRDFRGEPSLPDIRAATRLAKDARVRRHWRRC